MSIQAYRDKVLSFCTQLDEKCQQENADCVELLVALQQVWDILMVHH